MHFCFLCVLISLFSLFPHSQFVHADHQQQRQAESVLNQFDVHSFVFLLPPSSFAYGQITLGLELYKRGHRVIFATLDGLQKHYDQQYHSIKINNEERRRTLIEPEVISFGPHQTWGNRTMMQLVTADPTYFMKHPEVGKQAMIYYSTQFETVVNGIEKHREQLGESHPLYSQDSLFLVPGPFKVAVNYLLSRDQPFALVLPSPGQSFTLSSPVFAPFPFSGISSLNKTFKERVKCLFSSLMLNVIFGRFIPFPFEMMDCRHLFVKPVLKLITSIPPLTSLKYSSPSTIYTGPLVNKDRTDFNLLDPQVQRILSGPLPVVYASFGTFADLSSHLLDFIVKSILSRDNKWAVIWALKDIQKEDLLSETVERIKSAGDLFSIVPWTNTPSVLAHNNTIAFVSHCGGNGLNEAVALGKPVIGIPLFGDQPENCKYAQENLQSAVCHSLTTSSPEEIYHLINDIVSNPNDHPLIVGAKKAGILTTSGYRGVETAANWLETAAALKGDLQMLETPVEREGVVKSYCLDILIGAVIVIYFAGMMFGTCWTFYLTSKSPQAWASWVRRQAAHHIPVAFVLTWGCRMRTCLLWCRRRFPASEQKCD